MRMAPGKPLTCPGINALPAFAPEVEIWLFSTWSLRLQVVGIAVRHIETDNCETARRHNALKTNVH
jgi:hypothetical protein